MQTVHNVLTLLFLLLSLCLLPGCGGSPMEGYDVHVLNHAARENKNLFNGRKILDTKLNGPTDGSGRYGVNLEDMTIRKLTMNNVEMKRARFKNVTFVDCTFVKVDFEDSRFENVKFIRGSISCYKRPEDVRAYKTVLDSVSIDRLLFDGVEIGRSVHMNFFGEDTNGSGVVVMRNVTVTSKEKGTAMLLGGIDLHVRIDNCVVEDQYGVSVRGQNSSAYITNSRFTKAQLKLTGKVAWVENCTLRNSSTPEAAFVVVRNCRLERVCVGVGEDGERYFLVNNSFTRPAEDRATLSLLSAREKITTDNAHLYLYADGHIPGTIDVNSGNVHIYGAEIDALDMRQQRWNNRMASLNLQNVKIGKGDWEFADLRAGKWENVRLGKPIDLNKAKIGPIIGHRVDFTHGYPWINGKLEIIDSSKPLEFDKPPVPTLEELGLAQFWKEHDFPVEQY